MNLKYLFVTIIFSVSQLYVLENTYAKTIKSSSYQHNKVPFEKKSKTLGLCLGVGGGGYNYYGSYVQLPLIALVYDQGIINNIGPGNIGIGGILAYKSAHYDYSNGYTATWTNVIIGARGTYHLTLLADKNNKFDPYGGVTAGIRINKNSDSYYALYGNSPYRYSDVNPIAGLFVGAKYNFTPKLGAFAEAGFDISLFRAGFHINF